MNDLKFEIVGFDLDGTLLETHRDLGAAVNYALDLGGFNAVPSEHASDLIGGGAKVMLRRAIDEQGGLDDESFRKLYKSMLGYYADHNTVHTRPYPHVREVLTRLQDHGMAMAVVTNKFESFARQILSTLDLASYFDAIIGGDTMGKGRAKPAPDPIIEARKRGGGGKMAFIGDSSYDIRAARAAQVPVIGARYGYCDKPRGELGADIEIDSFAELIPALARLG